MPLLRQAITSAWSGNSAALAGWEVWVRDGGGMGVARHKPQAQADTQHNTAQGSLPMRANSPVRDVNDSRQAATSDEVQVGDHEEEALGRLVVRGGYSMVIYSNKRKLSENIA